MYAFAAQGQMSPSAEVTVPESILLSLIGFAVVFFVLVMLIVVIQLIAGLSKKGKTQQISDAPVNVSPSAALQKVPASGSAGEVSLFSVDDKTAAMLMAIVADEMQTPLNELRFISITELEETK